MWKLKCFKFFLQRLADLERVLQQEERLEEVNITRVEMCESLMEYMAVKEKEAMEECKMAAKQRVRWANVEEGQKGEEEEELASESKEQAEVLETKTERSMGQVTAVEEDRPGGERDEKMKEEKQETAEKEDRWTKRLWRQIKKSFKERDRDCMVKEADGQFRCEEWEWESSCIHIGASEPRRSGEPVQGTDGSR